MSLGKSLSVALAAVTIASVGFAWASTPEEMKTDINSKTTIETKAPDTGKLLAARNKKDKETLKQEEKQECKIDKNGVEKCESKSKAWSTDQNANDNTSLNPSGQTSTYE